MTTASGRRTTHKVTRRRRLVRGLIVEGIDESEIARMLELGVELAEGGRRIVVKASKSTVRRDVAAIADEFRGLFDSDEARELEIGAAYARLKAIAVSAASGARPQYTAAIRANEAVIRIASGRSDRWRHLVDRRHAIQQDDEEEDLEVNGGDARRAQLREMTTEGLQARASDLAASVARLKLKLVGGTAHSGD